MFVCYDMRRRRNESVVNCFKELLYHFESEGEAQLLLASMYF
jgi:hypothetical protein